LKSPPSWSEPLLWRGPFPNLVFFRVPHPIPCLIYFMQLGEGVMTFLPPLRGPYCFLLQPFFVQLHFLVLFILGCWSSIFVPLVPLLDWCFFFNKVWQWLIIADYCFHFWVNGMVLTFKIIGFNMARGIKVLGVSTNWMDEF
jgi:hypothetical protein